MASLLRKKQAPRISHAEWNEHRHIIESLYQSESLQDVRRKKRQEYGFDATTSQYTTKLKQWGATKNRSSAAWQALDSSLQRRGLDAVSVEISHNGSLIPPSRAARQIARYRPLEWQRRIAVPRPVTPDGVEIRRRMSQTARPIHHLHRLPWIHFVRHIRPSPSLSQSTAKNAPFGTKYHVSLAEVERSMPDYAEFGEARLVGDSEKVTDHGTPANSRAGTIDGPTVLSLFKTRPQSLRELSDSISSLTSSLISWTKPYTIDVPNEWSLSAFIPQIMHENPEISVRAFAKCMAFVVSNNLGHAFSPRAQTWYAMKKATRCLTADGKNTDFTMNAMSSLVMLRDRRLGAQVLEEICAVATPTSNALLVALAYSAVKFGMNDLVIGLINKGIIDAEVHTGGEHPTTLLETAITCRNNDMILFLHREGVDIQCYRSLRQQNKIWSYDKAASPGDIHSGLHKSCALSVAANLENPDRELKTLLQHGARPSNCDVLVKAVDNFADPETVRLLLKAGADPNQLRHESIGTCHSSPRGALDSAIERGGRALVEILLQYDADVDGFLSARHRHGIRYASDLTEPLPKSPLLLACEKDQEAMVEELLQRGANPNLALFDLRFRHGAVKMPFKRPGELQTYYAYPMQAAVGHGNMALIRRLKDYGASLSVHWGTPLVAIAVFHDHKETLEWLIKEGADINATTESGFGFSALEAAIYTGNMDLVQRLCREGADINLCPTYRGAHTPLQAAAESGEFSIFDYLYKEMGADIHAPTSAKGISLLESLIYYGETQRVDELLGMGVQVSRLEGCEGSPLSVAISVGDRSMVQKIVTAGADINDLGDNWGLSLEDSSDSGTSWGVMGWVSPLLRAVSEQNLAIVQELLHLGAHVGYRTSRFGMTPLFMSVNDRNYAIAECLLKNGADPNVAVDVDCRFDGFSPLIWAARLADTRMVDLLLHYGADVNMCCHGRWKETTCGQILPLDAACEAHDLALIETLLQAGAEVNLGHPICACLEEMNCDLPHPTLYEILKLLVSLGADMNRPNKRHKRPLDLAVFWSLELVQYLVQAGADIHVAANGPQSSLFFNAITQAGADNKDPCDEDTHERYERYERYTDEAYNTCEFLLQKWNGDTAWLSGLLKALRWIAQDGVLRFAHLFLKHGVPVSTPAIFSAAEFGRLDMLKLLIDNYVGSECIETVCAEAMEYAVGSNQLVVVEFLDSYQPPGGVGPMSSMDMEVSDEEASGCADPQAHEEFFGQPNTWSFHEPLHAEREANDELETVANADITALSTRVPYSHDSSEDIWLTMPPDDPMEGIHDEDAEFFAWT